MRRLVIRKFIPLFTTLVLAFVAVAWDSFGTDLLQASAASVDKPLRLSYQNSTLQPTTTPQPESTLTPSPTIRIKPTPTPLVIPPPSNPGTRRLMIAFGILIVIIVIIGIWINRSRIF